MSNGPITPGRIVRFNEPLEGEPKEPSALHTKTRAVPAFVTGVEDGMVSLAVFPPGGVKQELAVIGMDGVPIGHVVVTRSSYEVEKVSAAGPNADGKENGCWSWPPRA